MIYKKDTSVKILDNYCASWVKRGEIYIIDEDYNTNNSNQIHLRTLDGIKLTPWACGYGQGFKVINKPDPIYEVY